MRTERKPITPPHRLAKLPRALAPLKELQQWAGWRFTKRNGKWSKPPYQADDPRRHADINRPSTFRDFDTALMAVQTGAVDGASFMFTPTTPFASADLDGCMTSKGALTAWGRSYVNRAQAAAVYVEYSPSGTGLRFVGTTNKGAAKVHRNEAYKSGRVELFRGTAKALTITGRRLGKETRKLGCIDEFIDWAVGEVDRHKAAAARAGTAQRAGCSPTNRLDGLDLDEIDRLIREGTEPDADGRSINSNVFHAIVGHYVGMGWSDERITERFQEHPQGIGARYIAGERLAGEVERSANKFRKQAEPQTEAVRAPKTKPAKVSRLKRKTPAESAAEPDEAEDEEELPPIYSHGDAEDPNEPDDWLVKGLLPIPGRGMLSGRSNIGKSFVLVDLAVRLGLPPSADVPALFLGHKVPHPAGTLIFSAEGGHREMKKRIDTAVRIATGDSETKLPVKWFTTFPRLRSLGALNKLTKYIKKARAQLQREHGVDIGLIAFDTLGASVGHTKANEANDTAVMQDVMNRLLAIAETFNVFVLVVHHPPKGDEAESSGSGALENNSDTWLCCLGKRHKSGRFSNTRLAIVKNKRGGMVGAQYPYTLHTEEIGRDKDDDPVTTNVVKWSPQSTFSDDDADVHAPTDPWVSGLRQEKQRAAAARFKRVLYALLADPEQAIEAPVSEGGAGVRMVSQKAAQAAFFDRTADEDEEGEQTRQGKHQAFSRARDRAEERQLIGIGKVEGETHLWLCQSPEGEPS